MGGWIASRKKEKNRNYYIAMLILSFILLTVESIIGVLKLHVESTIMWFTAPFAIYYLFMLAKGTEMPIRKESAKVIRNISTLIYTSQFVWIYLLNLVGLSRYGIAMFLGTSIIAVLFSIIVIQMTKKWRWLGYSF